MYTMLYDIITNILLYICTYIVFLACGPGADAGPVYRGHVQDCIQPATEVCVCTLYVVYMLCTV